MHRCDITDTGVRETGFTIPLGLDSHCTDSLNRAVMTDGASAYMYIPRRPMDGWVPGSLCWFRPPRFQQTCSQSEITPPLRLFAPPYMGSEGAHNAIDLYSTPEEKGKPQLTRSSPACSTTHRRLQAHWRSPCAPNGSQTLRLCDVNIARLGHHPREGTAIRARPH